MGLCLGCCANVVVAVVVVAAPARIPPRFDCAGCEAREAAWRDLGREEGGNESEGPLGV